MIIRAPRNSTYVLCTDNSISVPYYFDINLDLIITPESSFISSGKEYYLLDDHQSAKEQYI